MEAPADRRLLDIDGVVGDLPSFGADDLEFLRWCAMHYVAPLSVILRRTIPQNIPRASARRTVLPDPGPEDRGQSGAVQDALTHVVASPPYGPSIAELLRGADPSRTTVVVAPTVHEVEELAASLQGSDGFDLIVAHSELSGSRSTAAWTRAATGSGICMIGTREIALWPFVDMGHVIVVEDARRVMRSPSTPTIGVREVMIERCRTRRVPLSTVGPLASLEMVVAGAVITAPPRRQWPLVEIADRSEEPPTTSPLLDRTRAAIARTVRDGGRAFVLVPRRGHAAAMICLSCGSLRRCTSCGAASSGADTCERCGTVFATCSTCGSDRWRPIGAGRGIVIEDLMRVVGDNVGERDDDVPVVVGTERDLVGVRNMALAVAVEVDTMALAPTYRASEDALRLLVRLAQTLEPGRGRRCLVQTSDPGQPVIAALRAGDPARFFRDEAASRKRAGFPPYGQLIALEVSGDPNSGAESLIATELDGLASVLGPAELIDRHRWLIHGRDLTRARVALRHVVGLLRDRGARVRVDVDPIDL